MEVEAYPRGLSDLEKGNQGEIWGESVWVEEVGWDRWPTLASTLWEDLMSLEEGVAKNWFNSEVVHWVDNGISTSFWLDKW